MKKQLFILILLITAVTFGQTPQPTGTRYPNATNEGDTITVSTKMPLFNNDGILNSYLNIGDLSSIISPSISWGDLIGTLSDQTDLQDALDLKANDNAVVHLANFETITGQKRFSNGIDVFADGASSADLISFTGNNNVSNSSAPSVNRKADKLAFMMNDNGGSQRFALFDGALITGTDKTFTFPNLTGTIALTSDLATKLNNTTDTFTGALTVTQDVIANAFIKTGGTSSQFLKADGTVDGAAYVPFASYTAADVLSKLLTVDGSGSGLDADLLDGVQGGSYLRSDVSDTKTSGALFFSDSVELIFGTGNDMRFGHDGTFNNLKLFNADFRILQDNTTRFTFGRTSGDFTATGTATAISFNSTAASGYSIGGNVIADKTGSLIKLGDISSTASNVEIIGNSTGISKITMTDDTVEIDATEWIILHNDLQLPTSNIDVQGSGSVSAGQYRVNALNTAPATATSPGSLGEIRYTADYIYVCIATDTWVRAALSWGD